MVFKGPAINAVGFNVPVDDFVNALSPPQVDRYRLPAGEMIYLCRKWALVFFSA